MRVKNLITEEELKGHIDDVLKILDSIEKTKRALTESQKKLAVQTLTDCIDKMKAYLKQLKSNKKPFVFR